MSRSALIETPFPSIKETASRAKVSASRVRELENLADYITGSRQVNSAVSNKKTLPKKASVKRTLVETATATKRAMASKKRKSVAPKKASR